jgi:hypothetical protein
MKTVMIGYIIDVQTDENVNPGFVQLFLRTNIAEGDKKKFELESRWFDKDFFIGFDSSLNKVYWVTITSNENENIIMVQPALGEYEKFADMFEKPDCFKDIDTTFMTEDKDLDLFGNQLNEGDTVQMPEPNGIDDAFSEAFVGTVECFRGRYITVRDGDNEFFDVEPERVKKLKE